MPRWTVIPIALIALLLVGLPVAALTDTEVERDVRRSLGLDTGVCEPMTDEDSAWMTGPSLPYDLDEPRAATIDGKVYLVGGITGLEETPSGRLLLEPSDQLTRFDPRTGEYESLAPLPRPLSHIGVFAYEGDLYVLGGYGRHLDIRTSSDFFRYSPRRDEWSRLPDMPSRREHVGQAVVGDKLFVLGGRSEEVLASDVAEAYDVSERRWERLPKMPRETGGLIGLTVDGSVVAVGGGNDMAGTVTGAVQRWDPERGRWTLLSGMRTPRHGHAAAVADGKIWVFGGSPCAYFNSTDSVEWLAIG